MGHKPSNFFQMDRPESGGANRKGEREAPELLDRAKEEFAQTEAKKGARRPTKGAASKSAGDARLSEPPARAARSRAKSAAEKRRKK